MASGRPARGVHKCGVCGVLLQRDELLGQVLTAPQLLDAVKTSDGLALMIGFISGVDFVEIRFQNLSLGLLVQNSQRRPEDLKR